MIISFRKGIQEEMEVAPEAIDMEGMEAKEMVDGGAGEPVLRKMPHALKYEVVARWKRARVGRLTLPHHVCDTPMFMPVGTQAPPSPLSILS